MPRKSRSGDGSFSRRAALIMIGGGGLMAIGGTGAFDNVTANRGFDVSATSDENALLGIKTLNPSFKEKDKSKEILKLANKTELPFTDIDVEITSDHSFLDIEATDEIEPIEPIAPGDDWPAVKAHAWTDKYIEGPVELTITAESKETTITATRSVGATTNLGPSSPEACPISPSPAISVTVDENAQGTVKNVSSVSKDVDGDVLISNGNDFDINAGSRINISGKIGGSSTGNIKLQNDKVGETIAATGGSNVMLKGPSAVKGTSNKPSVETGSGTIKIQHTTTINTPSSKPCVKTGSGGKIIINGKNKSNIVVISGDVIGDQINKIHDAQIGGNVTGTGNSSLQTQRAKIGGNVSTSGGNDIKVGKSTVCGTISSDGNVIIKNGSEVKSISIKNDGKNVTINKSDVTGNITSQSNGTTKLTKSTVSGNISVGGGSSTKVKILNNSTVKGNISGGIGCTVTIKATVEGDVTAGSVNVSPQGTVKGKIEETR